MSYKYITWEEKGPVGILTLNNPEKRNALSRVFEEEITECLREAARNAPRVKVIVLKAAGDIFCAGHDRQEILNQPVANIRRLFQTSFDMMWTIRTVPQCIIAQVQGIAMAGGCHLAAACDLITAAEENAKFGMTGLIYSYNCSTPTVAVSRAVPQKKAMEMLLTAKLFSAQEAKEFFLVNRVFPDRELEEKTLELAQEISQATLYAIYQSKQVYYAQIEMTEWQAYHYAKEMMALEGVSVNATEGFTASIEKRNPVWDESTIF